MSPRARVALIVGGVLLVVAALCAWGYQRRAELARRVPSWLDPKQPPENVTVPLAPAASLAANGCPPMTACCDGRGAGRRVRRTYPGSLADSSSSLVGVRFSAELGGLN
jgi:hypothetical protein